MSALDLVDAGSVGQVRPRGQVQLHVEGREIVRPYTVVHDVMVIEQVFPDSWCEDLVQAAELAEGWRQGTQVRGGKPQPAGSSYTGEGRTSMNLSVGSAGLLGNAGETLAECARFYRCWNRHVSAWSGRDWEIARYDVGQRFGLHVDQIAGTSWNARQLSAVTYLNDSFTGGATWFPRQGLRVRPPAGSVLLFPPGWTHPHEAEAPEQGTKYALIGWFYP